MGQADARSEDHRQAMGNERPTVYATLPPESICSTARPRCFLVDLNAARWGRTLFPACSQMDAMRSRCPISTVLSRDHRDLFRPASDPALFLLFSAGVHAAGVSPLVALEDSRRALAGLGWMARRRGCLTAPVLRPIATPTAFQQTRSGHDLSRLAGFDRLCLWVGHDEQIQPLLHRGPNLKSTLGREPLGKLPADSFGPDPAKVSAKDENICRVPPIPA
jgi:hypothetical protein